MGYGSKNEPVDWSKDYSGNGWWIKYRNEIVELIDDVDDEDEGLAEKFLEEMADRKGVEPKNVPGKILGKFSDDLKVTMPSVRIRRVRDYIENESGSSNLYRHF